MDWNIWIKEGHFRRACFILNRFLPASMKGRFDSDDFIQDAIVQLLEHPDMYDLNRKVIPLVIKIARRRIYDEFRHCWRERNSTITLIDNKGMYIDIISPDPSSLEILYEIELKKKLIKSGSTSKIRKAISLRLKGYKHTKIDKKMGWKRGAASAAFGRLQKNYCKDSSQNKKAKKRQT